MAVSTTNAISGPYITNGVTRVFPFTFTAPSASEVSVILRTLDGADAAAPGFSVSPHPGGGGSVTFHAPPPASRLLYVLLDPRFTQDIAFEDGSAWLASPVNEGYDRSAARDQALKRDIDRGLKVPLGESEIELPRESARANSYFAFDPMGKPIPSRGTGADAGLREDLGSTTGGAIIGLAGGATAQEAIDNLNAGVGHLNLGGSDNLISQYSDDVTPEQPCAIVKTAEGYELYSPLSIPGYYAMDRLERTTPADYRATSRFVMSFSDIYHEIFEDFTRGGTFGTNVANSAAVGGVYGATSAAGAYVEKQITLTGASTVVGIIYASRNTCHHIAVTINGGSSLVNLLPRNGAGERYVDGYSADTSPLVNRRAAIAILPAGTYTVRMTASDEKNPAAGSGVRMHAQGLTAVGGQAGLPWGERTHAPKWANGEVVQASYQRWWQGVSYRATGPGTTSGTSPLNDTGVGWAVVADTYAGTSERYLADVSEPFWAIWLALNGNAEEDFGGDIHGNVILDTLTVSMGGQAITPTDYEPVYARNIEVKQDGRGVHAAAPGVAVFTYTQTYSAVPGGTFPYRNTIRPIYSGSMGLYYPGMLPIYHYQPGSGFRFSLRRAIVQNKAPAIPSDYYRQSNPRYGNNNSLQIMGLVELGSPRGAGGVPAADKTGAFFAAVSLEMTRASMLDFTEAGALTYWDMNTGGADPSDPEQGFQGMLCKGYFRARTGNFKRPVMAGVPIVAEGIYRVRLFTGSAGDP